ncbi:site-specific DNA-methyltransferase [Escherichia marmotae]|uniref:DNA methyltransferase n=1 Tax=Escherichia ruysiae TaxID=2608867 RepID=UPI001C9AB279|nr:site-specific DNA-methyltransferase [Escherichia ruysiae]MBY7363563.1 site-specific DNA-methyltransferase [Escherichia ruysiae]MBY7620947.1 site-specific DNA-methyltransferase [Escherichia marmotae]
MTDVGVPEKIVKLHTVAPYIGKMRPEIASWAIDAVTKPGDLVFDPFCGSGTVLLEAWLKDRDVVGTDLNPYACLITKAKLNPYKKQKVDKIESILNSYSHLANKYMQLVDLNEIPTWVKEFYNPDTLKDLLAWVKVLKEKKDDFALACLLSLAHHQRPGFLSYPSSHTVPYLRTKKFPPEQFPELYEYRAVLPRMLKKMARVCNSLPELDFARKRTIYNKDASEIKIRRKVDAIITSPPYMGQLDYARDNRLRLFLMGVNDWSDINKLVSPSASRFVEQFGICLNAWRKILNHGGKLAIFVGTTTNTTKKRLDDLVIEMINDKWPDYDLTDVVSSEIPEARRARKNCKGSVAESLLIFEYK